ncbi:MAG: beta-lactamase family protein [Marinilabiliales bacterium]|nr:beta-lactamase family protein [Marinilabiliales bacterium]
MSGRKWQQFIAEEIFAPAGMVSSTITDGPHPEEGVAHGYELVNGEWAESDYGEFPTFPAAGNGGVWSSVTELALYEKAIRQNIFLGKELTDRSRTIYRPASWADTTPPFIGYSWFIGEDQVLGGAKRLTVSGLSIIPATRAVSGHFILPFRTRTFYMSASSTGLRRI